MKKKLFPFTLVFFCLTANALSIDDINIRDPYILPIPEDGTYYMYCTSSQTDGNGKTHGGVAAYKSRDLKNWEGPVQVFTVPDSNLLQGGIWAPEVHKHNGHYYLFATINSDVIWKKQSTEYPSYQFRGTQIFHSDSPEGPFMPFSAFPHTPLDQMALDGTLWIENGKPYMIYCHEWVQVNDGTMELVSLKDDLSATDSTPTRLFNASAAPWASPVKTDSKGVDSYVTDGCFLYRTKTGSLLMIWSSFSNGNYAVGIAESTSGTVFGPWKQQTEPLFTKDGGHGMIFTAFDGKPYIVLHQPNNPGGAERAKLFELEDLGHTIKIK